MESIIRLNAVKTISGLSRSTIYRLEKDGKFPKRFKIGERAIGWSSKEIFEWVNKRKNNYIESPDTL